MKVILACEGQSEVALLKSLIEKGHLRFDCPILLDEPIRLRQLDNIAPIINALPINEEIIIYRVGDTLKEQLSLSKFELRKPYISVYKVCTKPEIEILVIINEGLYGSFMKAAKNTKPKTFVKEKLPGFEPGSYFTECDMYSAIKEYKRLKRHEKDELYLFDLLS